MVSPTEQELTSKEVPGDSSSKKQGAYGKIPIHKESFLSQLWHIDELWDVINLLYIHPLPCHMKTEHNKNVQFCDEILTSVSRSFAAVIRQLPECILLDVAVFYLVLRALDTIEDDTTAFATHAEKIQHLLEFTKNALGEDNPNWSMDKVGLGEERRLLQEFPKCYAVYAKLPKPSRDIITDITKRMATGMAEFVDKDLGQGTKDLDQYNRYCHFVAGLVGEGLSRLFAASGLEDVTLAEQRTLSNQMGLFLQKTNIIRDFLEDYVDQRAFWPQSIWKKYGTELGYFCNNAKDPTVREKSLQCLDELIIDALELVPDCLQYMSKLSCVEVFRFCAIPQVMAIATLEKCYNNTNVFTGVVKIRKSLSCRLITRTNNLAELHATFYEYAQTIRSRCVQENAPHRARTLQVCDAIMALTQDSRSIQTNRDAIRLVAVVAGLIMLASVTLISDGTIRRLVLVGTVSVVYLVLGPVPVQSNLKPAARME